METKKFIENTNNHYYITSIGDVFSVERVDRLGRKISFKKLKPSKRRGYPFLSLSVNGKRRQENIHRLVAQAFIPNPHKKPFVNHINGIKTDNRVENLEWCTCLENNRHAQETGLVKKRKVYQFKKSGEFVSSFNGTGDASRKTNIDRASINNVILGNVKSAGGYLWSRSRYFKPAKSLNRKVIQLSMDGKLIEIHNSLSGAARKLGLNSTTAIRNCFSGLQKQAYGFKWVNEYRYE